MIKEIKEINLPSYATLSKATVTFNDMGEKTITSQVSIDGQITPDFSFDWEVEFKGEKYIMPLRQPQASKDNASWSSKIDLTFHHWAIYQLKRWYFFTLQSYEAGVAVADQYIASVSLNLKNFCDLYGQMLNHYFGDAIAIDLNPKWKDAGEPIYIDINYSYLWDVLIKLYELFAVRWEIVPNGDSDRYVIKVGYPVEEMGHIFEYGFEGGLMKVERQVQDDNIRNMLLGRGGDKNIPYRYFKNQDPDNPTFQADPDWVEELANVYFDRLRSAEFRSYIQGWKARHISKYPGYFAVGESNAVVPWAYRKGYSDTKFSPVEFVKDDESIKKYGELLGGLGNNDEIYPSIQGVAIDSLGRIDQVVDVEQVTGDTLDEQRRNEVDAWEETAPSVTKSATLGEKFTAVTIKIPNYKLKVPKGYSADVLTYKIEKSLFVTKRFGADVGDRSNDLLVTADNAVAFNNIGQEIGAAGLTEGEYEIGFKIELEADNIDFNDYYGRANITVSNISIAFGLASDNQKNQATFDIWIKNIWQTTKLESETSEAYAERVWKPILGNHLGEEAAVCFSTGLLSTSEDYTFLILGKAIRNGIHYDTSKSLDGVQSHWRLTLVRSDADYDSLGKLVPNLERQGKAGDYFYFTGIELTHYYVKWAENRLHDYKLDQLAKVSEIQPSWVVSLDKVRIGTPHYEETQSLLSQLHIGGSVRIADKRFIGGSEQLYLYLQQITYKYNENANTANLTPDTEVVLGTEYQTTANPVATIQSQIDAIHNQLGGYSVSNFQQIVRMVGDRIYLRKDGITDRSQSITYFAELLAALGFRQGMTGGYGWGIYQDENGKWVIETDRLNVRDEMQVNSLVINQIQARGGMIIESAASIEASYVEELSAYYKVYFDTKYGSVGNLFRVDDVAYCHRYTPENQDLKYYKRKVIEIGEDYIALSKTIADGQGIPSEGDVIVHYGNYTDKERQFVIVRDVMGGGYERMLSGLDSVTALGNEYYFAGYQSSTGERFFIGTRKDDQYIEYINGKLYIPGQLILGSDTGGGKTMLDYIKENGGLSQEEVENIAEDKAKKEAEKAQKDAQEYADAITKAAKDYLQTQIDGAIETWFYPDVPTLDNEPAINWKTDEQKNIHLGDLYYDQKTGKCYRFQKEGDNYEWREITDTAIQAALDAANKAQDTADHKRRVFLEQPKPPYDEGDLWVNATYGTQYKNDILRCKEGVHKELGNAFAISDWGLASDYTNDDYAHGFDYLSKALNDGLTEIGGGLILSSLIALGIWDSQGFQTIYSGINGQPLTAKDDPDYIKKGYGIAAWYGGDMLDAAFETNGRLAKTLFRFDGSGYLAGNKIGWREDGSGWLAGENITWDASGAMTFGSGIHIGSGDNDTTFASLINLANAFIPIDKDKKETTWAKISTSNPLYAIKARVGFYSDEFISALGMNSDGGGGGGGLYGLITNWDNASSSDTKNALGVNLGWDLYNRITGSGGINSRLSSLESGSALNVTTIGSGNAVTSITKSGTTITANKGTTFLTSHQSLANYVTLNTEQSITGAKHFSGISLDNDVDTSRVRTLSWRDTSGNTIASIGFHNTEKRLFLNPQGSSEIWNDAVGKYTLKIGVGEFTYNTYPIITSANIGSYNAGSATRLQGSYSLWGQTFYGNNVSGDMTSVGSIQSSQGISRNVSDIATQYGTNAYWYGLGLALGENDYFVTLGGYYGLKIFSAQGLLTILQGGNVGVGTSSPTSKLHVAGTLYASGATSLASSLNVSGTLTATGDIYLGNKDSENIRIIGNDIYLTSDWSINLNSAEYIYMTGKVGINTNNPQEALHVIGVIRSSQGIYSDGYVSALGQNTSSDGTLKIIGLPLDISLSQIAYAPSVNFRWRKNGTEDFGSIAQYWQSLNPLFAREDLNGHLSIDYGKLALVSVIAVAKEVISDKERIRQLERRISILEQKLREV